MKTEMGEYLVGAYLKMVKGCDIIDYNVRRPGGGLAGLDELDVMGLDFKNKIAYLCEVTTHLEGLLIGAGNESTVKKSKKNLRNNGHTQRAACLISPIVILCFGRLLYAKATLPRN
jgi:hypothetical protein